MREVFRRDKTSLSGRLRRYSKGVLKHRPREGLLGLWHGVRGGCQSPTAGPAGHAPPHADNNAPMPPSPAPAGALAGAGKAYSATGRLRCGTRLVRVITRAPERTRLPKVCRAAVTPTQAWAAASRKVTPWSGVASSPTACRKARFTSPWGLPPGPLGNALSRVVMPLFCTAPALAKQVHTSAPQQPRALLPGTPAPRTRVHRSGWRRGIGKPLRGHVQQRPYSSSRAAPRPGPVGCMDEGSTPPRTRHGTGKK